MAMSDSVMLLFPNVLQPAVLKTYVPVSMKLLESEQAVLGGMQELSDGWFARRQTGTRAALDAAKRMSEAASPIEAVQAYQDWFGGAMARLLEDGLACQNQLLKAGARFGAEIDKASEHAGQAEQRQAG
jgi:hypothetical protein